MKVFVKFFSKVNLGDDLFLKILFDRYPQIKFVISASNKYKTIFNNYANVQVIEEAMSKKSTFSRYVDKIHLFFLRHFAPLLYVSAIKKDVRHRYGTIVQDCEVFLSIGGSIFMQKKLLPTYGNIELYKFVNQNCQHVFYIGCNFGPYIAKSYKNSFASIFAQADDVCFRDKDSYEKFLSLENVRYAPDVVFNLPVKETEKIERSVGFSIISPRGKTNVDSYVKNYGAIIQYYVNKKYQVFLFSFCNEQGDSKTIEDVLGHISNNENITKVFYDGNIDQFIDIYSRVEKMYCGRFHAMILSMLFKQKFYPVIYSHKMTNVLDDIGYNGEVIMMEDLYKQKPEDLDVNISKNKYDITHELQYSKKQFLKLDKLLSENDQIGF